MAAEAPAGFARLAIVAGFAADFGPIYARRDGERVWFGFRVGEEHANPFGQAHGGALATFADMQLAALMRAGRLTPRQSPTISLSLDFLAAAKVGDWVEGEIMLIKRTGRLAFSETILAVDGAPVVRAKAIFAHSESGPSLDAPRREPPPQGHGEATPEGFEPLDPGPGFGAFFGPMFFRAQPPQIGFRVAPRHINLFGLCHGGALAMFADYQLAAVRGGGPMSGPAAATLSLSVDFLSAAALGDWIEADVALVRESGRFVFTQAVLRNADGAVARSTAIYARARS